LTPRDVDGKFNLTGVSGLTAYNATGGFLIVRINQCKLTGVSVLTCYNRLCVRSSVVTR